MSDKLNWEHIISLLRSHWQTFDFGTAVIIVIIYAVMDILFAYYTYGVVEKRPFRAANTGTLIYVLSAIGVTRYVDNYLYIIPLAIGGWLGTYFVVYSKTKGALLRGALLNGKAKILMRRIGGWINGKSERGADQ